LKYPNLICPPRQSLFVPLLVVQGGTRIIATRRETEGREKKKRGFPLSTGEGKKGGSSRFCGKVGRPPSPSKGRVWTGGKGIAGGEKWTF